MAQRSCSKEQYLSDSGRCCRRCEAGKFKQKDCDETLDTQCTDCGRGFFMATSNHLDKCLKCKTCISNNKLKTMRECTATNDTICECESGFYCSDAACGHCLRASRCPEGQGVKTLATRTNNTICSDCEPGTYSNVTDHLSTCRAHTRCEDIGRELRTPGTATADSICGNFKTSCGWVLPAGLWAGLVLTSLMVFALVLLRWRIRRRRLQRKVNLSRPEAPLDVVPADEVDLKLPLPSKELNELYQDETYKPSYFCERFAEVQSFEPDVISCDAPDVDDSSVPITPFKAAVSFTESQRLGSNNSGFGSGNYHRTISEPQEDEWCGT